MDDRGYVRSGGHRVAVRIILVVGLLAVSVVGLHYRDQITRYITHRKGSPTQTVAWAPFPDSDPPELHLAVAGDVGYSGPRVEATAEAVTEIHEIEPFDQLVLAGDNAYPSGDPSRLEDTVFGPFGPVLADVELQAVLGNHDVMDGHADAQVDALGMDGRWWARHLEADVLLIGLDSNQHDNPEQQAWLEDTLASATERWRIVVVHHPPYSAGYQGSSNEVRQAFVSTFERYGVQLVISGHEHDYQRSVPLDGVTYLITGGAAGTRRTGEADFTAVSFSWHHFVELAVFDDRLVIRAVNQDLRVADEAVLSP